MEMMTVIHTKSSYFSPSVFVTAECLFVWRIYLEADMLQEDVKERLCQLLQLAYEMAGITKTQKVDAICVQVGST